MTLTGNLERDDETHGDTQYCAAYLSDTRKVATHTFKYNNKVLRNYTVLVDANVRGPLWSAKAFNTGMWPNNKVGRTGSWGYDPAFDEAWQQTGVSGYSKGHLTASNDAQTYLDENKQTFYYSNQAPQIQNGFNDSVWNQLENAIQGNRPSESDTLYVVTGCIYESGSTSSVPKQWYKCLMKCKFSSPGVMTDAVGCAYLFENKSYSGVTYDDFLETIDEIERLTGFDFFPRVPSTLQTDAEKTNDPIF